MQLEPIRFIIPRFAYSDGRPAANIYIHLDVLGDDKTRYQHFKTDAKGAVYSGGKPAMLMQGEYDLCATTNEVHDDIMEQYEPFHVHIRPDEGVIIPEDIVVKWAWEDVHEYIESLEDENRKHLEAIEEMQKEIENLEEYGGRPSGDEMTPDKEKQKIQNIYANIEMAQKKIEENWSLVEKGKTKLKVLLDKQEDTLEILEQAEREKEELGFMREELEEKRHFIDHIFKSLMGREETREDMERYYGEEGPPVVDDEHMDGFVTDPEIETLQKVRDHITNIDRKRKQLELAREKILIARQQLRDKKGGMKELQAEMQETIRQYDRLMSEIHAEKEKLAQVRGKLTEGWDRLKSEYRERAQEIETEFRTILREKEQLQIRKERVKELLFTGKDRLLSEKEQLQVRKERVKELFFTGKDRLKEEKIEVLQGKQKLAVLGSGLQKQSVRIKEAVIAKQKFEDKYDELKELGRVLENRELDLAKEKRKMDRDHALRMEAYSQNDADIEDEFKALDEMRELIRVQRGDFVRDRLQFLKESMYYECPVCGGTIPVRSSLRPLRVQCPSCTTDFNLKPKQKYQCPECSETIMVTTSKRPLNVKCQKCASEFIIRRPYKFEEDIIPDRIKAKISSS